MGEYPTSGTRGSSSQRGPTGSPGGDATMAGLAAAGFLSPAAAKAMADAGRPLSRPPSRPALPVSTPNGAARTAGEGLARGSGAGRLLGPLALGAVGYGLYQMLRSTPAGWVVPPGWTATQTCGSFTGMTWHTGWSSCAGPNQQMPESELQKPFPANATSAWGWRRGNPYAPGGPGWFTWHPGVRYEAPAATPKPKYQTGGTQRGFIALPTPEGDPDNRAWDPLTRPGGPVLPAVQPLPYRFLPDRIPNPYRSPTEQPGRGNRVPVPPWMPLAPGEEGHPETPRRQPQRVTPPRPTRRDLPDAPDAEPEPEAEPQGPPGRDPVGPGETLPGWVADPGVPPGVDPRVPPREGEAPPGNEPTTGTPVQPQAPTVREEWPAGAAGPTIVVGGGPPVGPHQRVAPGPGTKERKTKMKIAGVHLVLRKVNKATDGFDVLDCLYGSLPKNIRWDIQRADWARQRAEGKVARPKDRFTPPEAPKVDLGFLSPALAGESVTLPGTTGTRRPGYADANANYIQNLSPQDKAAAVYRHADKLNVEDAVKCMVANGIEDRVIGALGQATGEAGARMGKLVGVETGGVF